MIKKKYIIILIFILVIVFGIIAFQKSFAINFLDSGTYGLEVKYNEYESLPKNYVQINSLNIKDAVFSSTNSRFIIKDNSDGSLSDSTITRTSDFHRVYYYGPLNFGTSNRTATADASMTNNNITGSFSLLYKNAATLSDGNKADVKITISDVIISLGQKTNDNVSGNMYVGLLQGTTYTEANTGNPGKNYVIENPDNSAKCNNNTKMKITMQILKSNTNTPIDSKYEQMLFGMYDIDVWDNTLATGKTFAERYNGDYAEGVEFLSGFTSPVVLGPRTSSNNAMNNLLQVKNKNGNMRLQGDGTLYQAKSDSVGRVDDDGTYYSGFIVPVDPRGFSFNWYGSQFAGGSLMGTILYGLSNVHVIATSGTGGTIEKLGDTAYNINSSTTYDYTPNSGYKVKSLKVNGTDVRFSEDGGTYTFNKLYKTPLVEVDNTGEKGASLGQDYTIDVQFEAKDKIKVTYVSDKNGTLDKYSEDVTEGDSPLGFVDTPKQDYKLLMIKCNKQVKLSDGTIILKEKPMTLAQLKKVIVEEPLTFNVYHKENNTKNYDCEN